MRVICILLAVALLAGFIGFGHWAVNSVVAETEIVSTSTEIVSAEITHADCTQRYSSVHGSTTTYRLSLKWDGNAEVIAVDSATYAMYKVGDHIKLAITTVERANGSISVIYNIG